MTEHPPSDIASPGSHPGTLPMSTACSHRTGVERIMLPDIRCSTLVTLGVAAWVLSTPMALPALAGCATDAQGVAVADVVGCTSVLPSRTDDAQGRVEVAAAGAAASLAGQRPAADGAQDGSGRATTDGRRARGAIGDELYRAWTRSTSHDLTSELVSAWTRSAHYPLRICWAPSNCASRY